MEEKQYTIPKNLNECFDVLNEIFNDSEDKELFERASEKEFVFSLHGTLGQWMRNEWGLWKKNTELYNTMSGIGLFQADDISRVILTSFYRNLKGLEINLKEQVDSYINFWNNYEKNNGPIKK